VLEIRSGHENPPFDGVQAPPRVRNHGHDRGRPRTPGSRGGTKTGDDLVLIRPRHDRVARLRLDRFAPAVTPAPTLTATPVGVSIFNGCSLKMSCFCVSAQRSP
jgi:hypothetical protein